MKLHLPVQLHRALLALYTGAAMLCTTTATESSSCCLPEDGVIITLNYNADEEEEEDEEKKKKEEIFAYTTGLYAPDAGDDYSMAQYGAITGTHYLVKGIVLNSQKDGINLSASERFYDNSKAYYLYKDIKGNKLISSELYDAMWSSYKQAGYSFDFLGDLKSLLSATTTSRRYSSASALRTALQNDTAFNKALTDDHDTCWYQATVNVLQHWLDDFGVFSHRASEMPYGFSYDENLVDDFRGVASLELGSYFYKYWNDDGGNAYGFEWFLTGTSYHQSYDPSVRKQSGGGNFFGEYFQAPIYNIYSFIGGDYYPYTQSSPTNVSKKALSDTIKLAFGNASHSTSTTVFTTPLYLAYYHFVASPTNKVYFINGGHAITCYGYSTDSSGYVNCLWIVDNEDYDFTLTPYEVGYYNLSNYSFYASSGFRFTGWHILFDNRIGITNDNLLYAPVLGVLAAVRTPESLKGLYAEYNDTSNPQIWNGRKSGGKWTGSEIAKNYDELPTESTGWEVYCATGDDYGKSYFPTYYTEGRAILFSDYATNRDVILSASNKTISSGDIIIDSRKDYSFTSNNGTKLITNKLTKSGSGVANFRNLQVDFGSAMINAGILYLNNATFKGSSLTIGSGSTLMSYGKNTLSLTGNMQVNNGGTFVVDSDGSAAMTLNVSKLTFNSGATFTLNLESANTTTALVTMSGSLVFNSGSTIELLNTTALTDGGTYRLVDIDNFSSSTLSKIQISGGSLAYENGYIVYKHQGNFVWGGTSGTWSPTQWCGASLRTAGKDVTFNSSSTGTQTVTVSQTVTPGTINISDGNWSFVSSTTSAGSIDVQNGVVIAGDSRVNSNLIFGGSSLTLKDTAQLTYNISNTRKEDSLTMSSGSTLTLAGTGSSAALEVSNIGGLAGSIVLNGADLIFRLSSSATLGGKITGSNAASELELRNTSYSDITYTAAGTINVAAGIVVGAASDKALTTLKWTGDCAQKINVSGMGVLELNGDATFSGTVQGTGKVHVPVGAELLFVSGKNSSGLDSTLTLQVDGYAQLGGMTSGGITNSYASNVTLGGQLVVLQESVPGVGALRVPSLTLKDKSEYSIYVKRTGSAAANNVVEHVLQNVKVESGTAAISRYETTEYVPYATFVDIQKLSGAGSLVLRGKAFGSSTVYNLSDGVAGGFSGNITVDDSGYDSQGVQNCYHVTALELGAGSYKEIGLSVSGNDSADGMAALGITGDVSLKGLSSTSASSYLYSGHLDKNAKTLKTNNLESLVTDEAHSLLINTDSGKSYSFAGSVLGSVNMVKFGSGTQTFTGEFGGFTGNVGVGGGRLVINDSFNAAELVIQGGGGLQSSGTIATQRFWMEGGQLTAAAASLSNGSITGVNTITATDITLNNVTIYLTSENLTKSALTLAPLATSGSFSFKSLASNVSKLTEDGDYMMMEYDSRLYNGALAGCNYDRSYYDTNGGSGYYTTKKTVNGRTVYTLMLHLSTAQRAAAALAWNASSGIWKNASGHSNSLWSGSASDRNFYDGDSVTFASAATVTVSGAVAPSAMLVKNTSGTITFNSDSSATSSISGSGALTKQGAGTLVLNLDNSYSGGTIIEGGTVTTGTAAALGTGRVELKGGTLNLGGNSLNNEMYVTGNATLNSANSSIVRLRNGLVLDGGTLKGEKLDVLGNVELRSGSIANDFNTHTVTVNGNVTLSGACEFTALNVDSGTLSLSRDIESRIFLNGGTLNAVNGLTMGLSQNIYVYNGSLKGKYTVAPGGSISLYDNTTLTGTLTLNGGFIDFFEGAVLDVNGTLNIAGNTKVYVDGIKGRGSYTIATYDTLQGSVANLAISDYLAENERYGYTFSVSNNSIVLTVSTPASQLTWSGGYGVWSNAGGNNWQMTDTNNSVVTGLSFYDGDKVTFDGRGTVVIDGDVKPGAVTVKGTGSLTLTGDGRMTGAMSLVKKDAGTLVLNRINTYTGGTQIKGGTVIAGAEQSFGSGTISLSGSAIFNTGSIRVMNNLEISDGTFLAQNYGGKVTVNGIAMLGENTRADITLVSGSVAEGSLWDSTLTAESGNINTLLAGNTKLIKNGTGNAYLSYGNTYSGGTTINNGLLLVHDANALGSGNVVMNGGSLNLQNLAVTNDIEVTKGTIYAGSAYDGSITVKGALTISSVLTASKNGGLYLNGSVSGGELKDVSITANRGSISSVISGASTVVMSNDDVTLSGNNSFSGGVYVHAGTLTAGSANALGSGNVWLTDGTLNMYGYGLKNNTIVDGDAKLMSCGNISSDLTIKGGRLTAFSNLTVSGNIYAEGGELKANVSGSGSLYKTGSGVAVLNGTSSLSGGIHVQEGTLRATGGFTSSANLNGGTLTLAAGLTMVSGQTLNFNGGSLSGNVTTAAGAVVELGKSANMTGNLTLKGGTLITNGNLLQIDGTLALSAATAVNTYALGNAGEYELVHYNSVTGSISNLSAVSGDGRISCSFTLKDNSLWLNLVRKSINLTWAGGNGNWAPGDATAWVLPGGISSSDKRYHDGDTVVFSSGGVINIADEVTPGSVTVSGSSDLTFTGSHGIGGTTDIIKSGTGTLTLNANNTYTGTLKISGGTVMAALNTEAPNNTSFGKGSIQLSGGTLDMCSQNFSNSVYVLGNATFNGGAAFSGALSVEDATLSGDAINVETTVSMRNATINNDLTGSGGLQLVTTGFGNVCTLGGDCTFRGTSYVTGTKLTTKGIMNVGELYLSQSTLNAEKGIQVTNGSVLAPMGSTINGNVTVSDGGDFMIGYDSVVNGNLTLNNAELDYAGETLELNGTFTLLGHNTLYLNNYDDEGEHCIMNYDKLEGSIDQLEIYFGNYARAVGYLTDTGTSLILTVTGKARELSWMSGSSGTWKNGGTMQWGFGSSSSTYADGDAVTFAGGGTVTISEVVKPTYLKVSGSSTLRLQGTGSIDGEKLIFYKEGSGTLNMNATNTYGGGTNISAGTVLAGGANSFGTGVITLRGGSLNLSSYAVQNAITATGGSLVGSAYDGELTVNGNLSLAGTTTAAGVLVDGGTISGSALTNTSLTIKNGTVQSAVTGNSSVRVDGTAIMNGSNSYTGGTVIASGALTMGNRSALGNGDVLLVGGSLDMNGYAVGNNLTVNGNAEVFNSSVYAGKLSLNTGSLSGDTIKVSEVVLQNGIISNNLKGGSTASPTVSVIKTGTGAVTLSGDNSGLYGKAVIQGGTLQILGGKWVSDITIENGLFAVDSLTLNSAHLKFAGGNASGKLTLGSIAQLTLARDAMLTGDLTLNGGKIFVDDAALDITGALTIGGGVQVEVADLATGTYRLFGYNTLSGDVSNLEFVQSNTRLLYEAYAESGCVYLRISERGGQLTWAGGSGVWSEGQSAQWKQNGSSVAFYSGDAVSFAAGGTITVTGKVSPDKMTVSGTSALTVSGSGQICGEGSLEKSGSGSLVMGTENSFSGGTIMKGGVLRVEANHALGIGSITLQSGTLNLGSYDISNSIDATGGSLVATGYKGDLSVSGNVTLNGSVCGNVTVNSGCLAGGEITDAVVTTYGGSISSDITGDSMVYVNGDATLTGTNTYAGNTYLNQGTLTLGSDSALGSGVLTVVGGKINAADNDINNSIYIGGDVTMSNVGTLYGDVDIMNGSLSGDLITFSSMSTVTLRDAVINNDLSGKLEDFLRPYIYVVGDTVLRGDCSDLDANINVVEGTLYVENTTGWKSKVSIFSDGTLSAKSLNFSSSNLDLYGGKIKGDITISGTAYLNPITPSTIIGSLTLSGGKYWPEENAVITVTGALTIGADLQVLAYSMSPGTHELISFSSLGAALPSCSITGLDRGYAARLFTENNMLYLDIYDISAGGANALTWNTTDGIWSASHSNWLSSSGSAEVFSDGASVFFNNGGVVRISGKVTPGKITVNTGENLSFEKAGSDSSNMIAGPGELLKQGKGELHIHGNNTEFTGNTNIEGGTLVVHANKALGRQGYIGLKYGSVFDANNYSVQNPIMVSKGTLRNATALSSLTVLGELTVDGVLSSESITVKMGGSIRGGSISNSTITAIDGSINSLFVGNNTLIGDNFSLGNVLSNNGTLTFSGTFDVSQLTLNTVGATKIDIYGNTGSSGFVSAGSYSVRLANGTGSTVNDNAVITHGGLSLTLGSAGIATATGAVNYGTYYLNASANAGVRAIVDMAGSSLKSIELNGGNLTLDCSTNATLNLDGGYLILGGQGAFDVGALSLESATSLSFDRDYDFGKHKLLSALDGKISNTSLLSLATSYKDGKGYSLIWQGSDLYLNVVEKTERWLTCSVYFDGDWFKTDYDGFWTDEMGNDVAYQDGDNVIFNNNVNICVWDAMEPNSVTIDCQKSIKLTGLFMDSGITGDASLIKVGKGTLTVNLNNSYTGGTEVREGTLKAKREYAFGASSSLITIFGGTLDMSNLYTPNDVLMNGAGIVKGTKLFMGDLTMVEGAELKKGSSVMLRNSSVATLSGGIVNGSISGGSVVVDGNASLGTTGKLTVDKLQVKNNGAFTVSSKGLAMNTKTSRIEINGGSLTSAGKLSAYSLTMIDGELDLANSKPMAVSLKGDFKAGTGADIDVYGAFSAANLDLQGATFTMGMEKDGISLTPPKAQAISLKDKYADNLISNTEMNIGGKMSVAGNLTVNSASVLKFYDPSTKNKAQSLAVKGSLNFGGGSSLYLNGSLSAKNLTLGSGTLTLNGAKLATVKVGNSLTLEGGTTLNLGFSVTEKDVAKGKAYKVFTFKTIDADITNAMLNDLLGLGTDAATLAFDSKRKAITLTVTDADAWNEYAESVRNSAWSTTTSENDAIVESAGTYGSAFPTVGINPMLGKVADTLVQSTWGTAGASRAFGDTIAARGTHATEFANGKGAAWVSTMGGNSRLSSEAGHAGADYTLTGAAFGMEARLSEKSTVGLAIGNSWGKVSTFSAFPVDADSTHQGIYGKHLLGSSTTLSWMAAHTRTESDAKLAGMACDWTQDALQLDARVDKLFAISDRTTVNAFGGLQYLATDSGECNGIKSGSLQNLRAEIGVGATHRFTGDTMAYGELSFIGDVVRNNPTADLGGLRSHGTNPGRAGMNLSVGASHRLNDDWSVNATYNLELMQNITSHGLNVGATYSF